MNETEKKSIEALYCLKASMETDIAEVISTFEETSGMKVERIDLIRTQVLGRRIDRLDGIQSEVTL